MANKTVFLQSANVLIFEMSPSSTSTFSQSLSLSPTAVCQQYSNATRSRFQSVALFVRHIIVPDLLHATAWRPNLILVDWVQIDVDVDIELMYGRRLLPLCPTHKSRIHIYNINKHSASNNRGCLAARDRRRWVTYSSLALQQQTKRLTGAVDRRVILLQDGCVTCLHWLDCRKHSAVRAGRGASGYTSRLYKSRNPWRDLWWSSD